MKTYEITINPIEVTEPGSLQFLSRVGIDDYSTEYIYTDGNGNEVHKVTIRNDMAGWLESQPNQTDGVVSYKQI